MAQHISRERLEDSPGEVYTQTVLEPSFHFMVEHYFDHLVAANRAWIVMLEREGIVDPTAASQVLGALDDLSAAGRVSLKDFNPAYEYFYSHVEQFLIERVGVEVAGEINIGRTRPEPLTRMALRPRLLALMDHVLGFQRVLLDSAMRERDTVMAHWTHMQTAQITTVGHHLMGLVDALSRDLQRLRAVYQNVNQCTLGCGALAGTSYAIDRDLVARLLGFDGVRVNTNDCVAAGDHVLETTAAVANLMITVSRICEDFYIWHTEEFGYVEIADAFAGSSSMMPQKKNAYPFEYARARGAHSVGHMTAAFTTLHNTNYQDLKDVEEEIVPPAFRSLDEACQMLRLLSGTVESMRYHREVMRKRAEESFASCTELAAAIHRSTDLSMRTAHRVVGHLVLLAVKNGRTAKDITSSHVDEAARDILGRELDLPEDVVRSSLDPDGFVRAHDVVGGPSPARMDEAIRTAQKRAESDAGAVAALRAQLDEAAAALDAAAAAVGNAVVGAGAQ